MLFNSVQFMFVFLPVVLAGFFVLGWLRQPTPAVLWLGLASLVFYGWDDPYRLLPIILTSIAYNFAVGRMLVRALRGQLAGLPDAGTGAAAWADARSGVAPAEGP